MKKNIKIVSIVLIIVLFIVNISTISIGVNADTTVQNQSNCTLEIKNITGIGNAFTIASNNNSQDTSITIQQAVQYLQNQGKTITNIKDINGSNIILNSTDLIGTGAIITTSDGNYTTIVYGDATGDGQIDASDIIVIVQAFLNGDSNLSEAVKAASDVYQDGQLNAADISQMINSFLGNLTGSILQTSNSAPTPTPTATPTPTPTPVKFPANLSSVVKAGDYVDYPISYNNVIAYYWPEKGWDDETCKGIGGLSTLTGWRVLSNSNGVVKLISNGTPERIFLDETTGEKILNTNNYKKYVNSNYAVSAVGSCSNEEGINAENNGYNLQNGTIWVYTDKYPGEGWLQYYYYNSAPDYRMGSGSRIEIGVRPTVTLKTNISVSAGNGTEANPWKLSK